MKRKGGEMRVEISEEARRSIEGDRKKEKSLEESGGRKRIGMNVMCL